MYVHYGPLYYLAHEAIVPKSSEWIPTLCLEQCPINTGAIIIICLACVLDCLLSAFTLGVCTIKPYFIPICGEW